MRVYGHWAKTHQMLQCRKCQDLSGAIRVRGRIGSAMFSSYYFSADDQSSRHSMKDDTEGAICELHFPRYFGRMPAQGPNASANQIGSATAG